MPYHLLGYSAPQRAHVCLLMVPAAFQQRPAGNGNVCTRNLKRQRTISCDVLPATSSCSQSYGGVCYMDIFAKQQWHYALCSNMTSFGGKGLEHAAQHH